MLEFEPDFFLGETRDDFYIEPMMKCAWGGQLEVLDAIARVCSKHNIRWFADWGTLLGAARHQGFIPWDDDMDICMLRADYDRFLQVAPEEFGDRLHLLSVYTEDQWDLLFARVVNALNISYDSKRLSEYHGCPYVLGIDIFPLDALPRSRNDEENQKLLLQTLCSSANQCRDNEEEVLQLVPDLENLCGVKFDQSRPLANQIRRAADQVCRRYHRKKPTLITTMSVNTRWTYHLNYEWYRDTVYLDFENVKLPCPGNYEAVLTAMYRDWQTPVRDFSGHDYPFYNKQKKALSEALTERILRGDMF